MDDTEELKRKKTNKLWRALFCVACALAVLLGAACVILGRLWISELTVRKYIGLTKLDWYIPRAPSYTDQLSNCRPNIGMEPEETAFEKGADKIAFVVKNASPYFYTYDPRHCYIVKKGLLGETVLPIFADDIGNLVQLAENTGDPPAEGETAEHRFEVSLDGHRLSRGEYTLYLEITVSHSGDNCVFWGKYLLPCSFTVK